MTKLRVEEPIYFELWGVIIPYWNFRFGGSSVILAGKVPYFNWTHVYCYKNLKREKFGYFGKIVKDYYNDSYEKYKIDVKSLPFGIHFNC